jgi:hypothetical protein
MDQSIKDQLEKWVKGESVHNTERDECCPDFSCCNPGSLAPQDERETFYNAVVEGDDEKRHLMLMGFLGRAFISDKVHIAGQVPDIMH